LQGFIEKVIYKSTYRLSVTNVVSPPLLMIEFDFLQQGDLLNNAIWDALLAKFKRGDFDYFVSSRPETDQVS
jgi:hypothetical protein